MHLRHAMGWHRYGGSLGRWQENHSLNRDTICGAKAYCVQVPQLIDMMHNCAADSISSTGKSQVCGTSSMKQPQPVMCKCRSSCAHIAGWTCSCGSATNSLTGKATLTGLIKVCNTQRQGVQTSQQQQSSNSTRVMATLAGLNTVLLVTHNKHMMGSR